MTSKIQNIIHNIVVDASIIALTTITCVTTVRVGMKMHTIIDNVAQITENSIKVVENVAQFTENSTKVVENVAQITENSTKVVENVAQFTENSIKVVENVAQFTENSTKVVGNVLDEVEILAEGFSKGVEQKKGLGLFTGIPVDSEFMANAHRKKDKDKAKATKQDMPTETDNPSDTSSYDWFDEEDTFFGFFG